MLIGTQFVMPKKLLTVQNAVFRLMPNQAFASMGFSKKDFIQLSKTMMDIDFSMQLAGISCPTLIVCGEKDTANKKASEKLAVRLSTASLKLIFGCGHEVNRQASKKLAAVLDEFYDSIQK